MLIEQLIDGNFREFLIIAVVLMLGIALHEFGHAFAADVQGDRGPRLAGRLTLNPLKHLDPVGTIFLVLVGFGWGKPVQFTPSSLRGRRAGAAIVAIAGPTMNVLLALIGAYLLVRAAPVSVLSDFATEMLFINLILAVFNMLPIPPLDGSRLLTIFLPPSRQHIIYMLDKWGFLLLLAVVLVFDEALIWIVQRMSVLLLRVFGSGMLPP